MIATRKTLPLLAALLLSLAASAPAAATSQPAPAEQERADNPPARGDITALMTRLQPSHPETVLIDYQKMIGLEPDYAGWAAASPYLDSAKSIDVEAIKTREENRLRRAYAEANPKDDILVVHANLPLDQYSTIQGVLVLDAFSPTTFFRYSLYGKSVALVPKDISNFHKIEISQEKMNDILGKVENNRVEAEILLRPIAADGKAPIMQDGQEYWLLMGDICEIRFWGKRNDTTQLVWFYRAPSYTPAQDKKLLDLYAH